MRAHASSDGSGFIDNVNANVGASRDVNMGASRDVNMGASRDDRDNQRQTWIGEDRQMGTDGYRKPQMGKDGRRMERPLILALYLRLSLYGPGPRIGKERKGKEREGKERKRREKKRKKRKTK